MKYRMVSVGELKRHPRNAEFFRDIKDESGDFWTEFKENIETYGVLEPLLVNASTMQVISGNQRLQAVRELKIESLPCVLIEQDDKEVEVEQLLSANIYRRQLDAIQLFGLVKILRSKIEGHQGKSTSVLSVQKLAPRGELGLKIKKGGQFVSAADLYNSLSKEQQKELREWFYDQDGKPTDKAVIEKVKEVKHEDLIAQLGDLNEALRQRDNKIEELEKGDKDNEDEIKILKKEKLDIEKALKAEIAKDELDHFVERMGDDLDEIQGKAAALSTAIAKFVKKANKTKVEVGGIQSAIVKSKLDILRGQLNQMFEKYSDRKEIGRGEE